MTGSENKSSRGLPCVSPHDLRATIEAAMAFGARHGNLTSEQLGLAIHMEMLMDFASKEETRLSTWQQMYTAVFKTPPAPGMQLVYYQTYISIIDDQLSLPPSQRQVPYDDKRLKLRRRQARKLMVEATARHIAAER